jgi:hypothetical protein
MWIAGAEFGMVGPNGLEPSTSSVSRNRSNQTELRAYMRMVVASILTGNGNYGNVAPLHTNVRNHSHSPTRRLLKRPSLQAGQQQATPSFGESCIRDAPGRKSRP